MWTGIGRFRGITAFLRHLYCDVRYTFWGAFGNTLHIFTFGIRAISKEHRVSMESEDPKRGTAVIDILGTEG
jgi:hypothetical protein